MRLFWDGLNGLLNNYYADDIEIEGDEIPTLGEWHHLALAYDGDKNWLYYLDGRLVKSGEFPLLLQNESGFVARAGIMVGGWRNDSRDGQGYTMSSLEL